MREVGDMTKSAAVDERKKVPMNGLGRVPYRFLTAQPVANSDPAPSVAAPRLPPTTRPSDPAMVAADSTDAPCPMAARRAGCSSARRCGWGCASAAGRPPGVAATMRSLPTLYCRAAGTYG